MTFRLLTGWLLLTGVWLTAAEYFIAPNGDDRSKGTRQAPWLTITKLNATLKAGDTATFLPGRFSGNIIPRCSGAKDAPITYRAETPGAAVLTGGEESNYAVLIRDLNGIVIDGFRFEVSPGTRWMLLENAFFCVVRNCEMEHSTIYDPIQCRNVHYSRFENVKAFRCNYVDRYGTLDGDMWNNYNVSHCVFEKLYISRVGHRPFGFWFDCEKNVVRDSVFDGRWCRNFEFFSPRNILMERCVITNAYQGSGSADGRAKLFTYDSIFRYNLIMRNGYGPLVINAYKYRDMPPFGMKRSRLYFNSWYQNQDCAWEMSDMSRPDGIFMVEGNIVKNNIMADNNPGDGTALLLYKNIAPDNLFAANLMRGRKDGDKTIKRPYPRPAELYTAEEANAKFPGQYRANFDADPGFVDAGNDNFNLKPDSPAIDRAEALTTVTETGKSIYLPVADARFFYDGYGIPGEAGDAIVVGKDRKSARVVRNDAENNVLTLDRAIEFAQGDTVNLPYAGRAPDLGAYECGMKTGPNFDPRVVREAKMDTATATVISCDFEENDLENWFHLWKYGRRINSFAQVDDSTAATGKRSLRVFFQTNDYGKENSGSVLAAHISPARWFIDRFPFVTFSYRIPKGVPVGVSVHADAQGGASPLAAEAYLGGSPALAETGNLKNLNRIQLIDDDRWHTVTVDVRAIRELFPDTAMLSRIQFWTTGGNGKKGDCYWIDDFAIEPLARPAR